MLTVTIDRDGHTDIDDCEKLSRSIDPLLDAKEFAALPPYTLCVSSAGIAREDFKRPEHFAAFLGSEVEVRFYRPDCRKQDGSRRSSETTMRAA